MSHQFSRLHVHVITLTMGLFCTVALVMPVSAQKAVQQSTRGDQSPAISTKSGTVNITYGMAEEAIKALQEFIASKDMENQELKRRLAEIHKNEFNSLPAEADEWATHFLATLPLRKDRLIETEKEERRQLETQKTYIPLIINFAIQSFDARIEALSKRIHSVDYRKNSEIDTVFAADLAQVKEDRAVRTASFPNRSVVRVSLSPGFIREKSIEPYPSLLFQLIVNDSIKLSFRVYRGWPVTFGSASPPIKSGVWYNPHGEAGAIISNSYKSQLFSAYDSLFESVFMP